MENKDVVLSNNLPQNALNLMWVANYDDETKLYQFEAGKENKYADINRERLVRFDMVNRDTNKPIYAMYLREGQQLIFRRRTLKKINQPDTVIFLVGYKQTFMTLSGPRTNIVMNYIHPDGSIALDGSRDNLELLSLEM